MNNDQKYIVVLCILFIVSSIVCLVFCIQNLNLEMDNRLLAAELGNLKILHDSQAQELQTCDANKADLSHDYSELIGNYSAMEKYAESLRSMPSTSVVYDINEWAKTKTYDKDSYNCVDYTHDARKLLKDQGIMSLEVTACNVGGKKCHMMMALLYESQTGELCTDKWCGYDRATNVEWRIK